jgi:hypothetical protein
VHASLAGLEPWRKKAFERILDTFFKQLGQVLADAPPETARDWLSSLRDLIQSTVDTEHLNSAVSCAIGFTGASLRLGAGDVPRAELMTRASALAGEAIERLGERPGLSRALNVLPVLAEVLERSFPGDRERVWRAAIELIAGGAPLSGVTLESCAELSRALAETKPAKTPEATVKAAIATLKNAAAPAHREVKDFLAARPADPLRDALIAVADAHPFGPAELYAAIRVVAESGRAELAPLIAEHASTPLAQPLLEVAPQLAPSALTLCVQIALAPLGDVDEAIVENALARAERGGRDDLIASIREGARREQLYLRALGDPKVAAALAELGVATEEGASAIASSIAEIRNRVPDARAPLAELWALSDPAQRFKRPPHAVFAQLLGALDNAGLGAQSGEAKNATVALAASLAFVVARLDGDPELPFQRILRDLEDAVRDPDALKWTAKRDAISLRAKTHAAAYVAAHAELPPELALSAGLHLSTDQLAWLTAKAESTTGRDTVRALRDMVYASITAGRLDLLDALRETAAPPKSQSKLIAFVARMYRGNRLNEVPFDRLLEGLRAGVDPVTAIEQEEAKRVLAELGLGDVMNAELDPAGIAELKHASAAVTTLWSAIQNNEAWDGSSASDLRQPFLDVISSVARGTWPKTKYESEVAKRTLANLSPHQVELWRAEMVTPLDDQRAAAAADLSRALAMLRGLAAVVKQQAPDLAYSREGERTLADQLAAGVKGLHETQKGSDEHRALSRSLGPLRHQLALVRFVRAVENGGGDPAAFLSSMKSTIADAKAALPGIGLKIGVEVLREVEDHTHGLGASPRQGVYAVDEDRLEPLFMSGTGGCCYYNGARKWQNISAAANANEKVMRVYDGANFVYRAYVKIYDGEIGDYKGPVMWLNESKANGAGSEQHRELLLRHAVKKAQAMGIPLVTMPKADHGAACNDVGPAAQALGLQASIQRIKVSFPIDTATGWTYADYWTGREADGRYFETTTYHHNLKKSFPGQTHYTRDYDFRVVMPR